MAIGADPARFRVSRAWQSIAIIVGAVALCLLFTVLVAALVPRESGPRLAEVSRESLPTRTEPLVSAAPPADSERELPSAVPGEAAPPIPFPFAAPPAPAPVPFDASAPVNAAATDASLDAARPDAAPADASPAALVGDAAAAAAPAPGVACGKTTCPAGKVCCNESCGTCTNPGELCDQFVCGMSVVLESVRCGPNTCNVGEVCCNASCGVCVSPGETCDERRRCSGEIQFPESYVCGMQTCNVGFVCCNPSCGICKRPGEPCSQKACG